MEGEFNLTGTLFKRLGAYVFDILIVSMLVSLLSYLPILNPNRTQYSEKYNELVNVYEQYSKSEISESEYTEAGIPITYELYRLNVYYVVIDIVIVILYFGMLPYFLKGQTLGKRLFQLRIVGVKDKPLSIVNYLLRCVVLNNVLISIALQCIVYFMSVDTFYPVYQNVNLVGYIILYISLFMIIVRRDGRGLHDMVANTKVVYIGETQANALLEEQKVMESEMEVKPKESNKEKKEKKEKVVKAKTTKAKKRQENTKEKK